MIGSNQGLLNNVLNTFNVNFISGQVAENFDHLGGQQTGLVLREFPSGCAGFDNRVFDFSTILPSLFLNLTGICATTLDNCMTTPPVIVFLYLVYLLM